jgi:rod shape determining protein RodA
MTVRPVHSVSFRSGLQIDMPLLMGSVAIATLGVVNLYSATSAYLGADQRSGLADIYVSQIYWIVVGFLFGILVAAIDYRHFERIIPVLYVGGLVSLALVFVFSATRGANRWISIGGFNFQPSEFMKVLVVLMVARHLHNDPKSEARSLVDLVLPALWTFIPVAAVMAQPDLGTSLIYLLSTISMLAITKIQRSSIFWALSAGLTGAWGLWSYGLRDYQKQRITSFLDPTADVLETGWHAKQSLTAIGNGGLTGEGFMRGTQNQFGFLPDQHSDFPFSVLAEDWGLLGCSVVLGVYCFISIWAVHIASQAKDRFGAAIAIGAGSIVFWHVVFNVGMSLGLLPVVGITLPLFSYGGSSVVTTLIALGLLMSVSMRR